MSPIPIAIALFTSTKGHFGRRDRWAETLDTLHAQVPLDQFAGLFANIKTTPGEEQIADEMESTLVSRGFRVRKAVGAWSHGDGGSHQREYLSDLYHTYNNPALLQHQYVLHAEDDWGLGVYTGDLASQFRIAVRILRDNPETVQVRFPRFRDEAERIVALYAKHGINGIVRQAGDDGFNCNDFSLNPSVFRSRDLKIATDLFMRGGHGLPQHVEHGLGVLVKHLSRDNAPLFVLNPSRVKAAHIGTKPGEEDPITTPVYAN